MPLFRTRAALSALHLRLTGAFADRATRRTLETLPTVGGLASIPSRAANLPRILDELLPQLDHLHLFLHGYDAIPDGVERPGVAVTLAAVDHPYRGSGKFFGLAGEAPPCLYFGFDDDILYRPGHVRRLRAALLRYAGSAVVGLHGATFLDPLAPYTEQRRVYHFPSALLADEVVDQLGAGTCAFVSSRLPLDPPAWPHGDMDDLMVAIEAERLGLKRIAVRRPRNSAVPLQSNEPDSLWEKAKLDDSRQTQQLRTLMRLMGRIG